jgi:D-alanine-D-alanine ligase
MAGSRKKVAVVFGGRSAEHEISIITGNEILKALDSTRYEAVPVYIDQQGEWYTGKQLFDLNTYKRFAAVKPELTRVLLLPIPGASGLKIISRPGSLIDSIKAKFLDEFIPIDVYFPAFHGQFGEDGCIQGLFEIADVTYTGCGVGASAIAMNKYQTKSILRDHGIPVLPGAVVHRNESRKDIEAIKARVLTTAGLENFPLFVKPLSLGSSVGVSKASDRAELSASIANALKYDVAALIEPCVTNKMEINISVRETLAGVVTSVTEIPVASSETLSYEDKYLRGGRGKKGKVSGSAALGMASLIRKIDPEDLDSEIKARVSDIAKRAFSAIDCTGVVRFDFMMNLDSGDLFLNELNPLPGSMAHYLWEKSNPAVPYTQLISDSIDVAIAQKQETFGLQRDLGFRALNK